MAKVIGFDESKKLKCTCLQCTAIIEYTPGEVEVQYYRDYVAATTVERSINCPNCGHKITGVKNYYLE